MTRGCPKGEYCSIPGSVAKGSGIKDEKSCSESNQDRSKAAAMQ